MSDADIRYPRVGIGLDVHALAADRRLVLGGVEIPHSAGLAGHSDGDALIHAIIDALLGAAARGDIGQWFPSSDPRWEGANSLDLLRVVVVALHLEGWHFINVDATVIAQQPRIGPHIGPMRERLAEALALPLDSVSIKATTTDHLGALGRAEGIGAQAIVSIIRVS
jgi:2-C-methyl-D-erythritol 2,4-cyclodiphosphate synthase